MRIKIDEKNRAVIAEVSRNGSYFKGVSVCSKDDEFDVDFGTKLAKARCIAKKNAAQVKYHEKYIGCAKNEIVRLLNIISNEEKIVTALVEKREESKKKIEAVISSKY